MASEWIPVAVAAVTAAGSGVAAWLTGRAGARKALEALATKVTGLERQLAELRALVEREDAEGTAGDLGRLRSDFERHLTEECSRRERARELGRQRDEALAEKLEALAGDVREQGTLIKLVLDGRVDTRRR